MEVAILWEFYTSRKDEEEAEEVAEVTEETVHYVELQGWMRSWQLKERALIDRLEVISVCLDQLTISLCAMHFSRVLPKVMGCLISFKDT